MSSPAALSSKLEREPNSYAIVDQRVSITLSTRLWGERDGVRGVLRDLCGECALALGINE